MVISDVATFKTLDRIAADDQPRIGGKAYNCARLKQAGVPVPDAIVAHRDSDTVVAACDDNHGVGRPRMFDNIVQTLLDDAVEAHLVGF